MHMQLYMCMHLSSAVRASELHAVYDEDIKLIYSSMICKCVCVCVCGAYNLGAGCGRVCLCMSVCIGACGDISRIRGSFIQVS